MFLMKKTATISFIPTLFFTILTVAYATSAIAEDGCVTGQCHQGVLKAKYVHAAAEACDTCHQPVTTPHPQKQKKTFKLTQEVPALCGQCHSLFGTAKFVHSPVKDGMCTTCHNPHGSAEPKLLSQPAKDLCSSCHPDKTDYKFVHGPAATGDCVACHNPHESKNKKLLIKDSSDLCFTCHIDMEGQIKKKFVHPALAGGCTSCHNPHGSSVKKFFAAEGSALCFQCHPEIENNLKSAKLVHPPIKTERGCASCHAPHASEMPKLLAKSGKDLCLDCHNGFLKKNQTVLHGPIKDGKCVPCHNPHGSAQDKLLSKPFSTEFYLAYSDNEYQLCFSCHNRDLLRNATTSYATAFRDGEKNLHYVHVNRKEKGRNCKACHVIHGGENPKLIANNVPFGKWNLPLRYVKTETGGSCAPGCHKKYSYDRKNPGKEAEPVKTKDTGKEKGKKK